MSLPTTTGTSSNVAATGHFTYQPLKLGTSIRVVTLLRGSTKDPIKCLLRDFDIAAWLAHPAEDEGQLSTDNDEDPVSRLPPANYKALSYEWGSSSPDDPFILLDNHNVRIRRNLYNALSHIRREDEDLPMWIDALSIDQTNPRERCQQVKIMGDIYKIAEEVIAWLGLAKDESDSVIDFLKYQYDVNAGAPNEPLSIKQMLRLGALCRRTYWTRVWIIQEIVNARRLTIVCGTRFISAKLFCLYMLNVRGSAAYDLLIPIYGNSCDTYIMSSLYDWLDISLNYKFGASEPRDYIYAMLGVATRDNYAARAAIAPDYEKDLMELLFETLVFCGYFERTWEDLGLMGRLSVKLGLQFDNDYLAHARRLAAKHNVKF